MILRRVLVRFNSFLTKNAMGVIALTLLTATFTEPVQEETRYWWSRATNRSGWTAYSEAAALMDQLEAPNAKITANQYDTAMQKMLLAAEAGIAQAMLEYGLVLCIGRSGYVKKDRAAGIFWIEKAALSGHRRAKMVVEQRKCALEK